MPPELYDKPVIETINTWSRFEVARLHGLVQLLDGDVQLQILFLVAYIIQVPSSTKMFLIHFLTHQMQFLKQAFCQEIWVTFEKFVSTIFFILSNFTYIHTHLRETWLC
jgi:hypothetical protein